MASSQRAVPQLAIDKKSLDRNAKLNESRASTYKISVSTQRQEGTNEAAADDLSESMCSAHANPVPGAEELSKRPQMRNKAP